MSKIIEQASKPGISQVASVKPGFAKTDAPQFIPSIDGKEEIYSNKSEKPSAKEQGFDKEPDSSADAGAKSADDQIILAQNETTATDAVLVAASSSAAGADAGATAGSEAAGSGAAAGAAAAGAGAAAGVAAMSGGMLALAGGLGLAALAGGGGGGGAAAIIPPPPPALPTVTVLEAGSLAAGTYNLSDTSAHLAAAGAIGNGAVNITATDSATVPYATNIAAFTNSGAKIYSVSDTAAAIVAAALDASIIDAAHVVSTSGTPGDGIRVADVATLTGLAHFDALHSSYDISDTAAAIVAAAANPSVTDAASVHAMGGVLNVADAATLTGLAHFDASSVYDISDTAANIVAAAANPSVMDAASVVSTSGTPGDGISVADVAILTGLAHFDALHSSYDISDTAANLAAAGAIDNGAVNITATTAATVAEAATIEAATNSGAKTFDIADIAANLAASSDAVLAPAGTVTSSDAAIASEADTIAAFAKAVVYSVSDTAAAIAAATAGARNEAVDITATGGANAAEAATLLGAANMGATTIDAVTATAAEAVAFTYNATGNDTITALTISGTADVAQATAIMADVTAGDVGSASYNLSDTAAAIVAAAATPSVLDATNVVATGGAAITAADAAMLHGLTNTLTGLPSFDVVDSSYNITDTAANIVAAAADASITDAFNVVSTSGTPGDGISVAGVDILKGLVNLDPASTYDISDTAANIVAAIAGGPPADASVTDAAHVAATSGALNVADATTLTGLAHFDAVNSSYDISDTAAAIVAAAADASVMDATHVVATDGVLTVAEAATLTGLHNTLTGQPSFDVVDSHYNISDTAANIVAAAADASITDAFNVVSTSGAGISVAQVTILTGLPNLDHANSSYDIIDTAAAIVAAAGGTEVTDAANVLSTSGTPGDGISVANAATLTALVNLDPASSYDISDTAAHIVLASADLSIINAASAAATDGVLTVAEAITLTALINFDAPDSRYDISDSVVNFTGALPADVILAAGEAGMVSLSNSDHTILSDTTVTVNATTLHFVSASDSGSIIDAGHTSLGRDYISGGEGADTINVSPGGDRIDLHETTTAIDTVVVAAGTSTSAAGQTAEVYHFDPGHDVLSLPASTIAADTSGLAGVTSVGTIMSHAIHSGMISFDSNSTFTSALHIDTSNFDNVVGYLDANIANGQTVAFYVDRNNNGSYADAVDVLEVFQHVGGGDVMIAIHDTAGAVAALGGISAADMIKIA